MAENISIEERLKKIEDRNKRVQTDKAWEVSSTRRILLFLFTYFAIALYLKFIVGIEPWINALVPSIGFFLSTLTLPFFKKLWKRYIHQTSNTKEE